MSEISHFPSARDDQNPFAAPEADLSPGAEGREAIEEAEQIRREYQKHEANVKSIGLLYYLGAGLFGLACIGSLVGLTLLSRLEGAANVVAFRSYFVGIGIGFGLIAVVGFALGFGLRRLLNWARWGAVIQTSLVLVLIVLGMLNLLVTEGSRVEMLGQFLPLLLWIYILSVLISPKNQVVFAPAYKEVIAQTPHIRTGTSLLVKILLAIVGGLILIAFILAFLAAMQSNH